MYKSDNKYAITTKRKCADIIANT